MLKLKNFLKKTGPQLLILFIAIFAVKFSLVFINEGPYMFSDETCILERAEFFAKNGVLEKCKFIVGAPANDPLPGYSLFISPIYYFLDGQAAYLAALVVNALLLSLLVWPLFYISKRVVPKISPPLAMLIITIVLFMPQVVAYEKMVLTESFFLVLNIWFLFFYLKAFEKDKVSLKLVAILVALLASITRPFGFIILIAMIANEIFVSKHKKKTLPILIPVAVFGFMVALFSLGTPLAHMVDKVQMLMTDFSSSVKMLISFKNALTTILVGTFIFTTVIFLDLIWADKDGPISKIRWFLVTFMFLNLSVTAYHIHGYLITGVNLDLLSRYLNMTIVYLNFFGILLWTASEHFWPTTRKIVLISLFVAILLMFKFNESKHSLNLDLSLYFDTTRINDKNQATPTDFLRLFFIPLSALLVAASFLEGKSRRTFYIVCAVVFLSHGALLYNWNAKFNQKVYTDSIFEFFEDKESNILVVSAYKKRVADYDIWRLRSATKNNVRFMYLNNQKDIFPIPNFKNKNILKQIEEFDYVLTYFPLALEVELSGWGGRKIYKVPHDE